MLSIRPNRLCLLDSSTTKPLQLHHLSSNHHKRSLYTRRIPLEFTLQPNVVRKNKEGNDMQRQKSIFIFVKMTFLSFFSGL